MSNRFNKLLALVPILLLTSVASTSVIDSDSLIEGCQSSLKAGDATSSCRFVVDSLSWYDWLSGSSSTQFHFIDLLELISSTKN